MWLGDGIVGMPFTYLKDPSFAAPAAVSVVVGMLGMFWLKRSRRTELEYQLEPAIDPANTCRAALALRVQEWFGELEALRSAHKGEMYFPTDKSLDYDKARTRPWSQAACGYPYVIARVSCSEDVALVIEFARRNKVPLSVLSGGHGMRSMINGAIVIDCYNLKNIELSKDKTTVKVGAGLLLGEVDQFLKKHNLLFPTGTFVGTGAVGLTLSGGWSWIGGKYGAGCLSLVGVDLVTADGKKIVATPDNEHAELLWASRGAGGNFGIVTSLTLRVYPVDPVVELSSNVYFAPTVSSCVVVARKFRDNVVSAHTDLCGAALLMPCGAPVAISQAVCVGDDEPHAKNVVEPFKHLGGWFKLESKVANVSYHDDLQRLTVPFVCKRGYCFSGLVALPKLTDEALDILVRYAREKMPNSHSIIIVMPFVDGNFEEPCGGRLGSSLERTSWWIGFEGRWLRGEKDGFEKVSGWCREARRELQQVASASNSSHDFLDGIEHQEDTVKTVFSQERLARLGKVKAMYDPQNVFRCNKNITPKQ